MTRQEYMQQLAALLAAMPEAERRDALDYYEEYFDAAGPEKEAQTIQELGGTMPEDLPTPECGGKDMGGYRGTVRHADAG